MYGVVTCLCTREQENIADFTMKPTPSSTMEHAGTQWAVYNRTFHKGSNIIGSAYVHTSHVNNAVSYNKKF